MKAIFLRLRCAIALMLVIGFFAQSLSAAETPRKGLPVITTHPRISLTPAVLRIVKAKVAARDPEWLALKGYADNDLTYTVIPWCESCCASNAICYNYLGSGYLLTIIPLGLAYQATGNVAYANKGIEIMKALIAPYKTSGDLTPIASGTGYPARNVVYGLALAYDWFYPVLDATTKADTINQINAWFDWFRTNPSAYSRDGTATSNYWGGYILGFGAAGYATSGDNPRAAEIIADIRGRFDFWVPPAFTGILKPPDATRTVDSVGAYVGGYQWASYNYEPDHVRRLFEYMQIIKDATGEVYPGVINFGRAFATSYFYNLKPNRWQCTDFGDFPGSFTGVMPGTLPLVLAHLLEGTTEGQWMQFYFNNLSTATPGSSITDQRPTPWDGLIYRDPSRPALDYRLSQPLHNRSQNDDHVFVRSDWSDNAVWASFSAGSYWESGHQLLQGGHITIQRGNDYQLVSAGQWRGTDGVTGAPESYSNNSSHANTIFLNNFGKYLPAEDQYLGGQGQYGYNHVLAYEDTANYVYVKSDLTDAYERPVDSREPPPGAPNPYNLHRSMRYFFRNFIYLDPNLFVVFDRVKVYDSTFIKKQYWHFSPLAIPTVTGTLAQSSLGSSTLFLQTLLPATPVLSVVPDPVSYAVSSPNTYRLEVSDSLVGTDVNFLTVMNSTARGSAFPSTASITSKSGNMVGALIQDPSVPRIVMLSLDGTPQSTVDYSAAYSGTGRHLVVDLAPGAYNVFQDGTKILSGMVASSAGTIAFDSSGGGAFTVTTMGAVASTLSLGGGNGQSGAVNSTLATPISVKLLTASGSPDVGTTINFVVTGGSATLSAPSAVTDSTGTASVSVTLGTRTGPVQVQANGTGVLGGPITFNLTATPGPPASLTKVSGDLQTGVVRSALLSPFSVKLADSFGNGVGGVVINYAVLTGGGTLASTSVTTDVNGLAPVSYTLGSPIGTNTVSASTSALPGTSVTFTATAVGGAASNLTMVSGDKQTGPTTTTLPLPFVVKVTDVGGNPVSGVSVTWTVVSGPAAFASPAILATDASGQASVNVALLATAGSVSISARAAGIAATVTFTATVISTGPANVVVVSGSGQSGTVGTPLGAPLIVKVTDSTGSPVPGASVTFVVTVGGGALSPQPVLTDATGQASATLTLPATSGAVGVAASVAGLAKTVSFSATANIGPASQIALISGNGQAGTVGKAIPLPLVVQVRDALGNPVPGFSVRFTATVGGGFLSASTVATDSKGQASTFLTLGPAAGTNAVEATPASGTLTGSPVVFNASGFGITAASIVLVSGDKQTAPAGTTLPAPLVVKLLDSTGAPVPGLGVNFAVTSGAGSITTPLPVVTDAAGQAAATFVLDTVAGSNTISAGASGLTPIAFTETGTVGPPSKIVIVSGDGQSAAVSATLPSPLVVQVTDALGNNVTGAPVTFTVTAGTATVTAAVATSSAGTASTTVKLGSTPGPVTIVASNGSATVTFSATALAGSPGALVIVSGDGQTGTVGTTLSTPLAVKLTDTLGNPLSGAFVVFTVTTFGSTVTPTSTTTDSTGQASTTLKLGSKPGTVTVTATTSGVPFVSFTATANTGPPSSFTIISGNGQTGIVTTTLSQPFVVKVADALGNLLSGIPVTFSVTSGSGSLSVSSTASSSTGTASSTLTLGPGTGPQTATASVAGVPALTFTATAVPVSAGIGKLLLVSGDGQSGPGGVNLPLPLVVKVTDAIGGAVAGTTVTFGLASGSGTVAPPSVVSNASGLAQTTFKAGAKPGPNVITATVAGLIGSPVVFNETTSTGGPANIFGGLGSTGVLVGTTAVTVSTPVPAGNPLLDSLQVLVTDPLGNPVSGATVNFTVTAGTGSVSPSTAATSIDGFAVTSFRAGTIIGTEMVTASVPGVTGTVTFTTTTTSAGPAHIVVAGTPPSTALVNQTLASPLQVMLTDSYDNPVGGVRVQFLVAGGNGVLLDPQPRISDASGLAGSRFQLGTRAQPNVVNAFVSGLGLVTFVITGLPDVQATVQKVSGDNQTAPAGSALPQLLVAKVVDKFGNGVPGVTVTATVTAGTGTAKVVGPTSASGTAQIMVNTGLTGGLLSVSVAADKVSTPAVFNATVSGSVSAQIAVKSGDNQTAVVGTALGAPLVVVVTDPSGNPAPGLRIDFAAASGSATFNPTSATTNSAGLAMTNVALGTVAGDLAITATVAGQRVTTFFRATATPGPAAVIAVIGGNNQFGVAGQALAKAIQVRVADSFGNPVSGSVVLFQAGSSGGVFSPPNTVSDLLGAASSSFTLGVGSAGPQTLTAVISGTSISADISVNAQAVPFVSGIVNPASFTDPNPSNPQLASNSLFSIFGQDLADGAVQASKLPLPTVLGSTSVLLGGTPTPLLFVSPLQINAIAPTNLDAMPSVDVVVVRNTVRSAPVFFRFVAATPGLFTGNQSGSGPVAALRNADLSLITPLNPARRGEVIVIYATGLGEVNNPPAVGQPAGTSPLSTSKNTPVIQIGGITQQVSFSGLAPGYVGLFQVNLTVSDQTPTGTALPIVLTIAGQTSNTATIAIREP